MPSSLSVFGEDRQAPIALAPINFDVCCLHHLPTLPVLGLVRCGSGLTKSNEIKLIKLVCGGSCAAGSVGNAPRFAAFAFHATPTLASKGRLIHAPGDRLARTRNV